jgi:hypothetical protein
VDSLRRPQRHRVFRDLVHVGGVPAARDGSREFVDHGVVDGARAVVAGISRRDQIAGKAAVSSSSGAMAMPADAVAM